MNYHKLKWPQKGQEIANRYALDWLGAGHPQDAALSCSTHDIESAFRNEVFASGGPLHVLGCVSPVRNEKGRS